MKAICRILACLVAGTALLSSEAAAQVFSLTFDATDVDDTYLYLRYPDDHQEGPFPANEIKSFGGLVPGTYIVLTSGTFNRVILDASGNVTVVDVNDNPSDAWLWNSGTRTLTLRAYNLNINASAVDDPKLGIEGSNDFEVLQGMVFDTTLPPTVYRVAAGGTYRLFTSGTLNNITVGLDEAVTPPPGWDWNSGTRTLTLRAALLTLDARAVDDPFGYVDGGTDGNRLGGAGFPTSATKTFRVAEVGKYWLRTSGTSVYVFTETGGSVTVLDENGFVTTIWTWSSGDRTLTLNAFVVNIDSSAADDPQTFLDGSRDGVRMRTWSNCGPSSFNLAAGGQYDLLTSSSLRRITVHEDGSVTGPAGVDPARVVWNADTRTLTLTVLATTIDASAFDSAQLSLYGTRDDALLGELFPASSPHCFNLVPGGRYKLIIVAPDADPVTVVFDLGDDGYPLFDPSPGPNGLLIGPAGAACATPRCQTVLVVMIDVHYGSIPSPINVGSNGATPVVIFGSETIDVTKIDPASLVLFGMHVRLVGRGTLQVQYRDVNGDGFLDLEVKFDTTAFNCDEGSASLEGMTFDDKPVVGHQIQGDPVVVIGCEA
jgi:hypothetical protein